MNATITYNEADNYTEVVIGDGRPTPLHVAELHDAHGAYCLIWQDGAAQGDEAQYASLEAAAWALAADEAKTTAAYTVEVHGDDTEYRRFTRALAEAHNHYRQLERTARAPRDKRTGRVLFVAR